MIQVINSISKNWYQTIREILQPKISKMFFLGLVAGLPLPLLFSSLSLWLLEAGIARGAVTFFSWVALSYSFKFIWAPLIDRLSIPVLTKRLGRRRAWLLVAQTAVITAIFVIACTDPAQGAINLTQMAIAAVMLGFSSATQDIIIDAYRIESAPPHLQALLSATYVAGYRVGMIIAGAGALYLATIFGSQAGAYNYHAWQLTYFIMAIIMLLGPLTTFFIREPTLTTSVKSGYSIADSWRTILIFISSVITFGVIFFFTKEWFNALKIQYEDKIFSNFLLEFLHMILAAGSALSSGWLFIKLGVLKQELVRATWIDPILDFFRRYGVRTAWLLLTLIGLYRISDIVLGDISNIFYFQLGFSKPQIATAVKTFGVLISILGGVLGGILATRYGVAKILLLGALLSSATNLIFVILAQAGSNLTLLYLAVGADNLAAGLASAAFVAFLSSLTHVAFTAVQYAIFSSLMTLLPKFLGGYAGSIVDGIGYPAFFVFTALLGVPVIGLAWLAVKNLKNFHDQV